MIIYQAKSKDNLVDFLFLNSSHLCLLNRAKKKAFAILSRSNYRLPELLIFANKFQKLSLQVSAFANEP